MIESYFKESIELKTVIASDRDFIGHVEKAIVAIGECLRRGGKFLIAGNGGSAADAQHFAGELVGRFKRERRAYPAIALTTDTSIITAWSNDYSFDEVFARQVEALGQEGDIFLGISTSGNSKNLIAALKKAKEQRLTTIGFLGRDGGVMKELCDIALVVPSMNTPRIQEVHVLLLHAISEEVEKTL